MRKSSRLDNLDLLLEYGLGLHFLNGFEVSRHHDNAFHLGHLSYDWSISIVRPCWLVWMRGRQSDVEIKVVRRCRGSASAISRLFRRVQTCWQEKSDKCYGLSNYHPL